MEVLALWINITELPNINMIVTFTKRVQIQLRPVNHLVKFYGLVDSKR